MYTDSLSKCSAAISSNDSSYGINPENSPISSSKLSSSMVPEELELEDIREDIP